MVTEIKSRHVDCLLITEGDEGCEFDKFRNLCDKAVDMPTFCLTGNHHADLLFHRQSSLLLCDNNLYESMQTRRNSRGPFS